MDLRILLSWFIHFLLISSLAVPSNRPTNPEHLLLLKRAAQAYRSYTDPSKAPEYITHCLERGEDLSQQRNAEFENQPEEMRNLPRFFPKEKWDTLRSRAYTLQQRPKRKPPQWEPAFQLLQSKASLSLSVDTESRIENYKSWLVHAKWRDRETNEVQVSIPYGGGVSPIHGILLYNLAYAAEDMQPRQFRFADFLAAVWQEAVWQDDEIDDELRTTLEAGLKYVVIENVQNVRTRAVISKIYKDRRVDEWDGSVITVNEQDREEYRMLLGADVVAPVEWAFLSHRGVFGDKSISRMFVRWRMKEEQRRGEWREDDELDIVLLAVDYIPEGSRLA